MGVSLLAALLLLATGGAPAQAAPTEVKPISWDVGGIGASGRTLRLQYTPGSRCGGTFLGARARVTESASTVTIELFDVVDFPPPSPAPMPCPAVGLAPRPVWVTLAAPLAGRSIKGRIPFPGSTVPVGPRTTRRPIQTSSSASRGSLDSRCGKRAGSSGAAG